MGRIGIYGGTFNPPHVGHFLGAQYALEALALDKLWMIPCHIAPHKAMPANTPSPRQRMDMVSLGLEDGRIEVSPIELDRQGTSYTWETVAQVRKLYPEAELFLLMGTDMFETFPRWKNPERIYREATLAVLCRGDKREKETITSVKRALEEKGARIVILDNPVTEISSSNLRRMLAFDCAKAYLPEKVMSYIQTNGLYGVGRNLRALPIEELEQVVTGLLKPNRVAHVLGCRQTAVELARIYGADEVDAARAALLHDITKALDGPLQLTLCREYDIMLDTFSSQNPKTLHALTGSLVAQRIFGEGKAVVDAICCHTTGKADMSLLEKILYVADYMEPNRIFPGVEQLRSLAYTDITRALQLGLEMTLDMLRSQKREISPQSLDALRFIIKGTENPNG